MESNEHLFRREWGRMVSALTRLFGIHNLALAEDVVQEAFCRAIETWRFHGRPENPQAWLMATAKNCAVDALRRERTARELAPGLEHYLRSEWTLAPAVEELLAPDAIKDDLLRMMLSCCQPRLPVESQIALILHILCGFSVDEVAAALLGGYAAAEKRITRAKKMLAGSKKLFDVSASKDFTARLPTVQRALYLLFNEGYHGASRHNAVRSELCHEALRLIGVLLEHPCGATPESHALAALMCLNAARLPGRVDALGELQTWAEQDRSCWDPELVAAGLQLLEKSARGTNLSQYHLEAAIAACHTTASDNATTDWPVIASLYDSLMSLQPSPVVALNRAIALAQAHGPERGLAEIDAIDCRERLYGYPFYHAALAELESRCKQHSLAGQHFQAALKLARNPMEKTFLERRAHAYMGEKNVTD